MRDEDLDKVIRDAASQHHPPYDDKAWEKMEELLDEHLPQKKDRKRPFFFMLFFLLLGSAVFFTVKHFNNKGEQAIAGSNDKTNSEAAEQNKSIPAKGSDETASSASTGATAGTTNIAEDGSSTLPSSTNNNTSSSIKTEDNATATNPLSGAVTKKSIPVKDGGSIAANTATENIRTNNKSNTHNQKGRLNIKVKKPAVGYETDKAEKENIVTVDKERATAATEEKTTADNSNSIATPGNDTKKTTTTITPEVAIQKTDSVKTLVDEKGKNTDRKNTAAATEKEKKKNKKSFGNNFAITVAAGADISYIRISNAGKLKPVLGAGLSYNFGKHITVSSGFYVSKKVYAALPEEYHSTGYTYPYLVDINGDCKIYEIPLNVYYNFKQVKNHNWLAGAGLSTFLMKKESYDYNYKYPGGQTYQHNYTVNNENNHYLSVLTLTAGYRYTLSRRFSFTAAPYMKIPLAGVGAGKVKLNSAGVLVTAAVYPFAKKK